MKKIYIEESKSPQNLQSNSPKNKEDGQIPSKKNLLPQDVVEINNKTEVNVQEAIFNQYKIYDQKLLVNNIKENLQEVEVSHAEAKKLYAEICQDLNTSNISMQNMQKKLINCTFQRQLGQISDKQAQDIIYGILPGSVEGIELLETTVEKLKTLEAICLKLNTLAGDIPEYNIAQFSIEYTKSSIQELQNCFQENLNIVDEMENKLEK